MSSKNEWLLAAYQGSSVLCDKEANLQTMKKQMERASFIGAKLIIFPELYTTGYSLPRGPDDVRRLAETQNGHCFQRISEWAKELNVAVVYGYAERETEGDGTVTCYNSALFIDNQGKLLANFRKLHLWPPVDPKVFKAGSELPIVNYEGVRIAILICYDIEFPEIAREAALKGAQLIVVPTASEVSANSLLTKARALENHVYVAYINHCGQECDAVYCGESMIINPLGVPVVAVGDGESFMLANVDIGRCVPVKYSYLTERRPELYKTIAK